MTAQSGDSPVPGGGNVRLPTPYYEDDQAVIYNADCLDVLPHLAGVDLVFTSPPYNLGVNPNGVFGHWKDGGIHGGNTKWKGVNEEGIGYVEHDDAMPIHRYQAWQQTVLAACWETLDDAGAIYYNHKPRVQAGGLWSPLSLNPDLPVRQIITWARAGGTCFTPTAYVPTYEWIIVFAKPKFRLKSRGASGAGDVWRIPQQADADHPASFPVALPATAIETVGPSLVLDPFMGVGKTLQAARLHGTRAIGIETSERYCEIAARRLQATKEGAA